MDNHQQTTTKPNNKQMNIADSKYVYECKLKSVYDGDTIRVDISLGLGAWLKNQPLRLLGIDTPELRGEEREEGLEARDYVRQLLSDPQVKTIIRTHKDKTGKFGRYLAEVWYGVDELSMTSLNKELLELGYAEPYEA